MSYSEGCWLRGTKGVCLCAQSFIFGHVFTHLTVIAFHMIVSVHGYHSNGFVRALEINSDRQAEANLGRRHSGVLLLSLTKASKDQ